MYGVDVDVRREPVRFDRLPPMSLTEEMEAILFQKKQNMEAIAELRYYYYYKRFVFFFVHFHLFFLSLILFFFVFLYDLFNGPSDSFIRCSIIRLGGSDLFFLKKKFFSPL
ncbi:Os05g0181650 [Oryza sativa Japonica Group]|uniref:Os05g0181650 protein n=1 Tax=Oryza sativa subsp. japonica TaxID=39947 RepID=A0A0P0WIN6_ORYSJ|nr:hypothetical protein EE612_027511 [Oryza sativa]KAF2929443.1 hypothetical protein DAI22_05g057800 [Oryza sativa Japonica Group]BAS92567.1 Os05g0181650 [Oryza sativa Japonica Group]